MSKTENQKQIIPKMATINNTMKTTTAEKKLSATMKTGLNSITKVKHWNEQQTQNQKNLKQKRLKKTSLNSTQNKNENKNK